MKKLLLTLFIIILSLNSVFSQTANYSGVRNATVKSFTPIMVNDEVKGYYMFYLLDKISTGENIYALTILDNNLKQTHYVELQKSSTFNLLESGFNGETFCFIFHDPTRGTLEYALYDKTGKELGQYNPKSSSPYQVIAANSGSATGILPVKGTLIEVADKGFIRYSNLDVEMFDNRGQLSWTNTIALSKDLTKKPSAGIYPFFANESAVFSLGYESIRTFKSRNFMLVHNTKTGELVRRIELSTDKRQLIPFGVTYDPASQEFVVYGEYFKPNIKVHKAIREGFFVQSINADGEITKENYSSWLGDIESKVEMNSKGKLDKGMRVMIHKMVKTADGKYFAIGEQYKKTVNGLGMATLGYSGDAMFKIVLRDMMIFEFDKDFKIEKVHSINKGKTNIHLMKGFGLNGAGVLAYYCASRGWFDYSYTSVSGDRRTFNASYQNRARVDGKKRSVIGSVSYTKAKEISTDKIVIQDKPTLLYVMPAKPGYVAVFKYYRKKKSLDTTLEKLNF